MINVLFNGRLGADAEVRQGKEGKEFISFRVAVNEKRGGERKTSWMNVRSANTKIAPYLKKGTLVAITGDEEINTFVSKSGETQFSRDVRAFNIDFINAGNGNENNGSSTENQAQTVSTSAESAPMSCGTFQPQTASSVVGGSSMDNDTDDLPF